MLCLSAPAPQLYRGGCDCALDDWDMVTAIINQMSYSCTQAPWTDQYTDITPPSLRHTQPPDKLPNGRIVQLITLIVISVCFAREKLNSTQIDLILFQLGVSRICTDIVVVLYFCRNWLLVILLVKIGRCICTLYLLPSNSRHHSS